jgi:hypothetical protein
MSQEQEIRDLKTLTSALMDYGWFVPPFVVQSEVAGLGAVMAQIAATPPSTDADKRAVEEKIHAQLMDVALSTQLRARFVWYAMRTPHLREYSHIIESAVLAYYKREYAAAVCLLLTAFEGVILSLSGFNFAAGTPKPSFKQLKATVQSLPLVTINPAMDAFQDVMRDALGSFVGRWLYENTPTADFTLSVLNRHYVLHGMEPGNFYRPHDVHRLLFAMDILIELTAVREKVWRAMVPNDATGYTTRHAFYGRLRDGEISVRRAGELEQQLLAEHDHYVAPLHEAIIELRQA